MSNTEASNYIDEHRNICPNYDYLGRHFNDRNLSGNYVCGCKDDCPAHPSNTDSTEIEKILRNFRAGANSEIEQDLDQAKAAIQAHTKSVEQRADKVDRFEVIDETGRAYVKGSIYGSPVSIELSYQDDDRTLKVFVKAQHTQEEKL